MPLAVDVIANAIRSAPKRLAAGAVAERIVEMLAQQGYVIIKERSPAGTHGQVGWMGGEFDR